MEIWYIQQDVGRDPRPLFSESVFNELIWELTRGSLVWAGKGFV